MQKNKKEPTSTETYLLMNSLFAKLPDIKEGPSFFFWGQVIKEWLDPFNLVRVNQIVEMGRIIQVFPKDYFKNEDLSYLECSISAEFHRHKDIHTGIYCISIFSHVEKISTIMLIPNDPVNNEKTIRFNIVVEEERITQLTDYERTRMLFLVVICLKMLIYNEVTNEA